MNNPTYSVVIAVYNRPAEIRELLESLTAQSHQDFEVIVVEDGSDIPCEEVVQQYASVLNVHYFYKPNTGPGPSRNFGFVHARGKYFVMFDSDCILPPGYFESVTLYLNDSPLDAWGGPDRAHTGFTIVQQAMGYTMSSVFTTGGIRGGKQHVGWFQPRSFNMGLSRQVFEATGGFRFDRFAEDIDLSIRIRKAGFRIGLIPEAFVYHKRRTNFLQFFKQVYNFGKGRVLVGNQHPEEVKITHWFPAVFTLGTVALVSLAPIHLPLFTFGGTLLLVYLFLIFGHALMLTRNFFVACLSIPSALLQLWGYGLGFLMGKFKEKK